MQYIQVDLPTQDQLKQLIRLDTERSRTRFEVFCEAKLKVEEVKEANHGVQDPVEAALKVAAYHIAMSDQ